MEMEPLDALFSSPEKTTAVGRVLDDDDEEEDEEDDDDESDEGMAMDIDHSRLN